MGGKKFLKIPVLFQQLTLIFSYLSGVIIFIWRERNLERTGIEIKVIP